MRTDLFDFELPEDRIALEPAVVERTLQALKAPAGSDARMTLADVIRDPDNEAAGASRLATTQ